MTLAPFDVAVPKEKVTFEVSVQVSLDDESKMGEGVARIEDPPKPINFNDLARQVRQLLEGTDAANTALKCDANYGYRGFRLTCDRTEDVREDGAFARALTARVELETGKVTKY